MWYGVALSPFDEAVATMLLWHQTPEGEILLQRAVAKVFRVAGALVLVSVRALSFISGHALRLHLLRYSNEPTTITSFHA